MLFGFIFYSVNFAKKDTVDYIESSDEFNNRIRELKIEKEKLQAELDMYDDIDITVPNMGSIIFMLSDTKIDHLDDAVNVMSNNGYYGVIALSKSHLPEDNDPNYFSRTDIDYLTSLGYETIIKLESDQNPIEVYTFFKDYGYNIKGFYIPSLVINIETINDIKSIGNMVIIGNFGDYEDEDIMLIEKFGNHFFNVKDKFMDAVDESKTLAISVGYGTDTDERYEYVNYTSMMIAINPEVDSGHVNICNITEAIERHKLLEKELDTINSEDRKKIKELRYNIEEINKELIDLRVDE